MLIQYFTSYYTRTFKASSRGGSKNVSTLRLVFGVLLFAAVFVSAPPVPAQESQGYRLAPGDRVAVRVLSWNALTVQFETYDALAGTFALDPNGQLALPLLGPVDAAGVTPGVLSEQLAELYRGRLGLADAPSVTVEIAEFGPVFVLGDVARPGQYDYAPRLNVIQAFALAGGTYRLAETQQGALSNAIRAAGSLEEIGIDLARERMTLARLEAEMNEAESFPMPEVPSHPEGSTAQEALYAQELGLFESRQARIETALESLREERVLHETEVSSLQEKLGGIERQLELMRESVGNMETLRERGLARSPALVDLQRTQIELEARELDAQTGLFRARQQISELERDANDLLTGRRLQVLQELQTSQSQIDRLETRRDMTRQLLAGAEILLAEEEEEGEAQSSLEFVILRDDGSGQRRIPATESTLLEPRDVLRVTVLTESE